MNVGDFVEILLTGENGQVVKCSAEGVERYLIRMKDLNTKWFLPDELEFIEREIFLKERKEKENASSK